MAESLQPDARKLFIIAGNGVTDRRWQSAARETVSSRSRKFETTYLFDLPYQTLIAELQKVPRDAIVVILTVFADSAGDKFIPADVAAELSALSPAPIYAPYDTFIGRGILGGYVETFKSVGTAAADMILEMFGKDPAAVPPPRTNPLQAYRVDFAAMQRWGLSESDLPPGTVVLNKPPSIWDQHRSLVLAALAVFVLQSAFLFAMLIQRRRRQRAEALFKESEERMTFTAASANVGLWQFDRKTGQLWATEHCRAMFGLGHGVPLTRDTFLSAVHPEDRATALASLRKIWEAERSAARDVRLALPDGQIRWVSVRARAHSDGHGKDHQVSGIFVDITDQKAAEAEAALQRQEVAHLTRVSTLGELSGAIAHEINQPLAAVQSNAETGLELLAASDPDLAEIRDVLGDIVHDNRRAGEVIQRMRNLMKKGERQPEPIDLNDLIHSTLALLNSELINRKVAVDLDLAKSLPTTSGDPVQLQQVILNLVVNAMDAMQSTPIDRRALAISTRLSQNGAVEIRVKDHGSGIAPAEQGRLFDPFFTTKAHGLGLGLTICSSIAQSHGGTLTLVNDDAGGAVALFSLPAPAMLIAAQ